MALEIRSFDPGRITGYCEIIVIDKAVSISHKSQSELSGLASIYNHTYQDRLVIVDTVEVCFEDWRTFPGGPPYSKVIAKEVIGVIKIACIHAGIGWRGYMPATKSLIQDKHLEALGLWHSSQHIRDATKIALVHLHRHHRDLFDTLMKGML